ncbi:MAG: rRNA pseudouridine synthase [Clostridiales bacterium]|nr:rRNA pseudouridine synthase [Clostridiales bacterium]
MNLERIDKMIALNCNVTRKQARELVKNGVVRLNGNRVYRAQETVDLEKDTIEVDGHEFSLKEHIYIMLNKPEGVISATNDPNKKTVIDIIPPELKRRSLFPCGRLDRDTTGLLIITDDGDLAHRIMSPSHHVYKTYEVQLEYEVTSDDIKRLENGIILNDGTQCLPAFVEKINGGQAPAAIIRIKEGKYHQVKRMFASCGNKVVRLRRIAIGALKLDTDLPEGGCRELKDGELEMLFIN